MKKFYITFRSVTPAQRGQRVLRAGGIHTVLQRTPRWMEERGCGYYLQLKEWEVQQAVELIRKADLPFSKVYEENDGVVTEWNL